MKGQFSKTVDTVKHYLRGKVSADDLNADGIDRVSAAAAETDRVLKTARMACNDFELVWRVAEAERYLGAFLDLITASPDESAVEQHERIASTPAKGLLCLEGFGTAVEAFMRRGFTVYSPRRPLRFRFAQYRLNRQLKKSTLTSDEPPP